MGWITPKTDWKPTDKFNAYDYNRIVGNILYVKDLASALFEAFDLQGMEEEKTYYSMFYAREMNAIEQNMETLNIKTYNLDIGDTKTYIPNGNTPNFEEFNRLEDATLRLFNAIYGQTAIMNHLAFKLGVKSFGKRTHYAMDEINDYRLSWKLGNAKGVIRV